MAILLQRFQTKAWQIDRTSARNAFRGGANDHLTAT